MKHSVAFDSEVKHYVRTPSDRTYRLLMSATGRFLELDRMDRNRKAQVQGQKRGRTNKVALTAASPEKDPRSSGGYPAAAAPPPAAPAGGGWVLRRDETDTWYEDPVTGESSWEEWKCEIDGVDTWWTSRVTGEARWTAPGLPV